MTPEIIPPFEGNHHPPIFGSAGRGTQVPRTSPAAHCLWLIRRGFWSIFAVVATCVAITAGSMALR